MGRNLERLVKVLQRAESGKSIKIGFIGGSITQGCNPSIPENAYVERVIRWFKERFPKAGIEKINAGVGATGSLIGVHRAGRDIIQYQPDLVFVEFAANDVFPKQDTRSSYESLIRKMLQGLPETSAVVEIFMTLQSGESAEEEEKAIAQYYKLPYVSYRQEIFSQIKSGIYKWEDIETDEVHPNDRGHEIVKNLIAELMEEALKTKIAEGYSYKMPVKPLYSDKYAAGRLLAFKDADLLEERGFRPSIETFRTINTGYVAEPEALEPYLKCRIKGKNIFLLFVKGIEKARAKAEIIIDGKKTILLDTAFPGGWGNYPETLPLISDEREKEHVIEVRGLQGEAGHLLTLLGFLVS